eukprot:COSAG03_NODE_18585_length_352_cov_0.786561_2_plen_53_part_01
MATVGPALVSTLLEFLEVAVHGILYARSIYPSGVSACSHTRSRISSNVVFESH